MTKMSIERGRPGAPFVLGSLAAAFVAACGGSVPEKPAPKTAPTEPPAATAPAASAPGATATAAAKPPRTLLVSAAISLKPLIEGTIKAYAGQDSTLTIKPTYGASIALVKQIAGGAPADLIITSDWRPIRYLTDRKLIELESGRSLATNRLSIVLPKDSKNLPVTFLDLAHNPAFKRIGVADHNLSPLGGYTRIYLKQLGVLAKIEKKQVTAPDSAAVLGLAERAEVDAAIVFMSEAVVAGPRVIKAFDAPHYEDKDLKTRGPNIVYSMAIHGQSQRAEDARALMNFFASARGKSLLTGVGLIVPRGD